MEESYLKHLPKNCKITGSWTTDEKKIRRYLIIECDIHGEFQIRTDDLQYRGCKQCKREKQKAEYDAKWKIDCAEIHNNKYDYTETVVGNVLTKAEIRCIKCNNYFNQTPAAHKTGQGCPSCSHVNRVLNRRNTIEDVIAKCESLGRNYDFSKAIYRTCKDKITIICDKGHTFSTTPDEILNADRGCSKCFKANQRSKQEVELFTFVKSIVDCEYSNRKVLGGLELDIYIPKFKLGIEFNGLYWHSENRIKTSHFEKVNIASSKDTHLIHVYEDDWTYKKQAVKNKLIDTFHIRSLGYTHISKGTYDIKKNNSKIAKNIYKQNSLDSELSYDGILSLKKDGEIHAIASYSKFKKGVLIKQIIRNPKTKPSNYYETFIEYFKEQSTPIYFLASLDWLDDIYLKNSGIENCIGLFKDKERYITQRRTSIKNNEKSKGTIIKAGYAIYKL